MLLQGISSFHLATAYLEKNSIFSAKNNYFVSNNVSSFTTHKKNHKSNRSLNMNKYELNVNKGHRRKLKSLISIVSYIFLLF